MIHTEAVHPKAWIMIQQLMQDNMFKDYFLGGDTALALQIGHRKSNDVTLYTKNPIGPEIMKHLIKNYNFSFKAFGNNHLIGDSSAVPGTDLNVFWKHNQLFPRSPKQDSGCRLMSIEEIGANTLKQISENGDKRDFVDLYYLLEKQPLNTYLQVFELDHNGDTDYALLKLLRCTPVNPQISIELLNNKMNDWEKIKERLYKSAINPSLKFSKTGIRQEVQNSKKKGPRL